MFARICPSSVITEHTVPLTLMGVTSDSMIFVLNNRTPQLMSNPTPPGETTAFGLSISKAAILPIINVHIQVTAPSYQPYVSIMVHSR